MGGMQQSMSAPDLIRLLPWLLQERTLTTEMHDGGMQLLPCALNVQNGCLCPIPCVLVAHAHA